MNIRKFLITLFSVALFHFGFGNFVSSESILKSAFAVSQLGDLSKFRSIAVEVQALVGKKDLIAAKKRIKDLETSWDEAEPSLKPRAAAEWHRIDKGIDLALSALRAENPDVLSCQKAMNNLLSIFDHAT